MYPHERSLVKKLEGRPFVIIGVNSDDDREEIKKTVAKEGLTWRSFWDGGNTRGPLATAYNVQAWPTIFVLDAKGVIRFTSEGFEEKKTDELIDELLKDMEDKRDGK